MKKLVMLSALLLLSAICMGADKIHTENIAKVNKVGMMQTPIETGACWNVMQACSGYWSNGACVCVR